MRCVFALLFSLALSCSSAAQAAEPDPPPATDASTTRLAEPEPSLPKPPIHDLAHLVVTGVQPGPGLWKVVNDDGHTLWVLGVVQPLPAGLQWQSGEVEAVIAQAEQLLWQPGFAVHWNLGFFSSLALLPSALRVRRNPDGAELEDVLPAELYARWRVQKDKYIGWKWGIDQWRPVFAADELYKAALDEHGLDGEVIDPVIAAAAKAAALEPTPVMLRTDVEEPRALVKEFNRTTMDDVACMERTLTRLEHELPTVIERANAWATGDIASLRRLTTRSVERSCISSILETDFARRHGYQDVAQQVRELWLTTAEQALADNPVTFALLSMSDVLDDDGLLAELAARGYRVVPPHSGQGSPAPSAEIGQAAAPL